MASYLTFVGASKDRQAVDRWLEAQPASLANIARSWFKVMRACGGDVTELLHDGHPTACVGDAAFGYVNVFTSHVNIGFFHGARLADPSGLLQGTGRFMRHIKARPEMLPPADATRTLIHLAYADIHAQLRAGQTRADR